MTRDTQGIIDDRDRGGDAEVFAALWAAAPFPRLPVDAPSELKTLAVDIDDPRRVYAIHRASRRHHFQILVERYIIQLRYGCQSKLCNTATCFSCRKRLAKGAPVRRYNATSARTLAIYLASQDNPEQGLCQNPRAERPIPQISKPLKVSAKINSAADAKHTSNALPVTPNEADRTHVVSGNKTSRRSECRVPAKNDYETHASVDKAGKDADLKTKESGPCVEVLEEPTTTDHRSFVQNVFGTVAFKMLEWLTPRNLEILAKSEESNHTAREEAGENSESPQMSPTGPNAPKLANIERATKEDEKTRASSGPVADPWPAAQQCKQTSESTPPAESQRSFTANSPSSAIGEGKASGVAESKFNSNSSPTHIPSSNARRRQETTEVPSTKGILNISTSPRATESLPDIIPLSRDSLRPKSKRRLSRQAVISSPQMHVTETSPLHEMNPQPARSMIDSISKASEAGETGLSIYRAEFDESRGRLEKTSEKSSESSKCTSVDNMSLPQSLSSLSIETIDLICNILQSDNTSEKHFLEPRSINEGLQRRRINSVALKRSEDLRTRRGHSSESRRRWRSFIEQAIFDVLSKPDSLLRSFSNEERRLFDTQTIWYLMLRLTRVAPSLVFDSLWIVAGTLFRPPERLETMYDWVKERQPLTRESNKAMPNLDAAQVINICLHALVAAAPLVPDARQLANMSRIRSYGLAMLGIESSALEPAALCLQYEDAFSNELAMRLARRLFAAIPTRRRYSELLELQQDSRSDERNREPDVLETVLATLKFLDLGSPPILPFLDHERDLHEKRVPTLILDWARTVMLQDWEGAAEVPGDGPVGGALAMMAAIYKNRKSLLLGDIHFRTEYFAERLDSVEMPLEWLSFEPNKRTVHLLDYPYLFHPSTLVTYFRAINYSRMNQSYEAAKSMQGVIRTTIAEHSLMTDHHRRLKLFDRLNTATSWFLVLEIRRHHVLLDTFNSVWRREERELMRPLKVRLGEDGGEEGLDSGGVQQEFFRLAIAEALNPDYGTFTVDSRTKMTWFQPGSPEPLWKFELIGMIFSLAVYNGLTLPVTFPKTLYRKLLDQSVTELHHIADGWPDLANGLTTLLEWDTKDGLVEDVFTRTYEFSVEQFGEHVSRDMGTATSWPQFSAMKDVSNPSDAPLVTNGNRNSYVSDYIRWLTDVSVRPQFEAFKSGFFTCIDRRSIALFDADTLQSVVEGIQEIDVAELRRATRYIGWDASHKSVREFWSIVKRYDIEQKRKLLEFVTASERVPVGGMRNLQFTLQRNGVDDGHLPSSYTCYGILLLPEYSTKEVLRDKLAMALENSKGFGFA